MSKHGKGEITTVTELLNAKPGDKIACGGGLLLDVSPKGKKTFRLRYKIGSKQAIYTIGSFSNEKDKPGTYTLSDARAERNRLKEKIASGYNPSLERKKDKLALNERIDNSFEAVTRRWYEYKKGKRSDTTNKSNLQRFERHAFKVLGFMPIAEINAAHLYTFFENISHLSATARKVSKEMKQIFSFGIRHGLIKRNPISDIVMRDILGESKEENLPHLIESELPTFFEAVYSKEHSYVPLLGLHIAAITFVRHKTLRNLKWEYFDFDNQQLIIPPELMKIKKPHIIPMPTQLLKVLDKLKAINGNSELLFPSYGKEGIISEHPILKIIHRAGYKGKMCVHGWRHTFSTIANESMKFNPDAIEIQQHHAITSNVRAVYNKAQYLDERTKLMQWWGGKLEGLGARF